MVEIDLTQLLTILLIRKGVLSEGEVEEERRRLVNKFRVGNVFTSEEMERIKKAIEDYIASEEAAMQSDKKVNPYRLWLGGARLSSLRFFLRGLEDRCCRGCWDQLMSSLDKAGLKDSLILKKAERVLSDPELQLIVKC
jgi:hypothetical protein